MTQQSIDRFMEYAAMKMPDLIRPAYEQTSLREVYRDYTSFVFMLPEPLSIPELIEEIDDTYGLQMMYHHSRSKQTDFGQSLCFFQEPGTGEMFQMDCQTDGTGRVAQLEVKLYTSMERMLTELRQQLARVLTSPGVFDYKLEENELIPYFF